MSDTATATKPKKISRLAMINRLYKEVGGPDARPPAKPHEGQKAFHASRARFRTSVWGRRAGKSLSGGSEVCPRLLHRHSDGYPARIWVVAPNYDLGEREWRVVWHQAQKLGIPLDFGYNSINSGNMALRTRWGAEVHVKSAERPDSSLLGEGLSFVIMAEAARHQRSTWDQYIEPALADRGGSAIFTSTPEGMNWLHLFHLRGESEDHPDWEGFQFPSWVNTARFPGGLSFVNIETGEPVAWQRVARSPDLPVKPAPGSNPKLVQSWKTLSRHYFWQEYGAQFRTQAGRIYPDFDTVYHVDKEWKFSKRNGVRNYRTIDYGTTNPFVCLDIQVDEYGHAHCWREFRRTGYSTLENVKWAGHPRDLGYKLEAVIGDPYEPDGRITTENEWGIPCQFVTMGVKNGIELVERRLKLQENENGVIRPRLTFGPRASGAIQEFQVYRWKNTLDEESATDAELMVVQDEENPKEDPLKANDHAPDAVRNFFAWFEGDTLVMHGEQAYEAFNEDEPEEESFAMIGGQKFPSDYAWTQ